MFSLLKDKQFASCLVSMVVCTTLLFGCGGGGGGSSSGSSSGSTTQMGGARQGTALPIATGVVSRFAGGDVSGSSDGSGSASIATFNTPLGSAIDASGTNLYVADGASNTVRKIEIATGVVTTLAGKADADPGYMDKVGADARFSSPSGVAIDANGKYLYVVESGNNTIRKVNIESREVTTLAGRGGQDPGTADGYGTDAQFNSPSRIVIYGANLYVTDSNSNTIRKVVIGTGEVTTIAGVAASDPGFVGTSPTVGVSGTVALFNTPSKLAVNTVNKILYVSDSGNRTIRNVVINTGVVTTLAGNANVGPASVDGTWEQALFSNPTSIVVDETGSYLYVIDSNLIRKVDVTTRKVTTLANKFNNPSGIALKGGLLYVADTDNNRICSVAVGSGSVSTIASIDAPTRITIDSTGSSLYVADSSNTIRSVTIATSTVNAVLADLGADVSIDDITVIDQTLYVTDSASNVVRKITFSGSGPIVTTVTSSGLSSPTGIAIDGTSLYVADSTSNCIRKVVTTTGVVSTVVGSTSASGSTDGDGTPEKIAALFSNPSGITISSDGTTLYVTDAGNNAIRKLVMGSDGKVTVYTLSTNFSRPLDVTIDGALLYIVDSDSHKISKLSLAGNAVAKLAGGDTTFDTPSGISMSKDYLYVSDTNHHMISYVSKATGAVTILAGNYWSGGSVDGTGTVGLFNYPAGITTDGTNLYVVDTINNSIRKIVIATGVVTTLGRFTTAPSVLTGITTDGASIFITDTQNNAIRKMGINGGPITLIAGSGLTEDGGGVGTDDNDSGILARFNGPTGITTDGTNLYVADSNNNTIRKIVIASTKVTTIAGDWNHSGVNDGAGTVALFSNPVGITTDGTNLYIADKANKRIRKMVIGTGDVTTLRVTGWTSSASDTSAPVQFIFPTGITTDGTSLYVVETGDNSKVSKVMIAPGTVSPVTVATGLGNPYDITTDGKYLFVTDPDNNVIRVIK